MFDFTHILSSSAFAQEAAAAPDAMQTQLASYFPFVLIFGVFYFLVIRPNQKKMAEQDKMIKALQRGDKVVTSGGIYGKIAKLEDNSVMLEIAEGVQIKINRDNIAGLEAKPKAAVAETEGEKK